MVKILSNGRISLKMKSASLLVLLFCLYGKLEYCKLSFNVISFPGFDAVPSNAALIRIVKKSNDFTAANTEYLEFLIYKLKRHYPNSSYFGACKYLADSFDNRFGKNWVCTMYENGASYVIRKKFVSFYFDFRKKMFVQLYTI